FSSRRRHTRCLSDWSSDVCSSDLTATRSLSPLASQRGGAQLALPPSPRRLAKRFLFAWRPRRCQWQNGPRANPSAVKEAIMATVLFVVKATIRKDREEAFNRWYNEDHVPQVLQFKGLVSARRYK